MVLDQFNALEQDCGILCLHQLEIHNLPQYLNHKFIPFILHRRLMPPLMKLWCHLQAVDFRDSLFSALGLIVGVRCLPWVG